MVFVMQHVCLLRCIKLPYVMLYDFLLHYTSILVCYGKLHYVML